MKWDLAITSPARRELKKISRDDLHQINSTFDELRENPYSGDIKFLRGVDGALRRRAGVWRIIFELDQDQHTVVILEVKRRGSNTY
jgi:mRNA-degrading endonuclease RelE of RelBE toxin-antitoxin system